MALPNFAVVDVETSGLNVRRHRVLQLAVITVDADGTVLDEWDTFVKLRWPLGRVGPTHIHGISRPMLKQAPRLDAVLDELDQRIGDSMFVAHNARFDGEFLLNAARRSRSEHVAPRHARAAAVHLAHVAPTRPASEPARIDSSICAIATASRSTVPTKPAPTHSATAAVLPHLLRAHEVNDVDDLEPFLDRARTAARSRR